MVGWRIGAEKNAKISALCPSSLAIGARFPYRTLVVIGGGGRGGGRGTTPTQPTTGWRQMHPHVARIGAKAVANIPTLAHEPGACKPGRRRTRRKCARSARAAGADWRRWWRRRGGLYQFIRQAHTLAHIFLSMRRAPKKRPPPQLGPRAHFARCTEIRGPI